MENNKLNIEIIKNILVKVLEKSSLFNDFVLFAQNAQKLKTPTVITQYDFTLISEIKNRWILFRIEDYSHYKKVEILINQLIEKKSINLDLQSYFLSELKIKNVKQKLIFKSFSQTELYYNLNRIIDFISKNSDERFKEVLDGKNWIDMPFDWQGYK